MAYDSNNNKYVNSYKRRHYKRIPLEVGIDFYTDELAPAAEKCGMTVSAFVKEAIKEKLEKLSK